MAISNAVSLANIASDDTLTVDVSNDRVGIGSTTPTERLDVVGVVSATSFFGDGSNLSGITAGATLSAGDGNQRVVVTSLTSGIMTATATDAELTYNSSTNTLSATNFSGTLSGNASTASIATTATNAEGLTGTPNIVVGIATVQNGISIGAGQSVGSNSGTVTYYGDGQYLTGISAGISTTASSPSANTVILLDLSSAQHHELTLTAGITTISCQNGTFGDSHSVVLVQPSSGIATVGFSTYFLFPSGSTPSMSEGGGKIDLLSFVVRKVGAAGTELLASAGLNYQ